MIILVGLLYRLSEGYTCNTRLGLLGFEGFGVANYINYKQTIPNTFSINESAISLIQNAFLTEKSIKTGIFDGFDQYMSVFVDRTPSLTRLYDRSRGRCYTICGISCRTLYVHVLYTLSEAGHSDVCDMKPILLCSTRLFAEL